MTSSSARTRAVAWVNVALLVPFGALALAAPWWTDEPMSGTGQIGFVCFGLAILSVPALSWLSFLAPARGPARVSLVPGSSGPALEVRLRPHRLVGTVLLSVCWSAFFAWAMIALGLDGPGWLVAPFLLLSLALLPDPLRALLRSPRLLVDADGVDFRGWSTDATIAWEDVEWVDFAAPHVRRPVLRLQGRPGSASFRADRHKLLVSLDLATDGPQVDIPTLALDRPERLYLFLDSLRGESRDERLGRLDPLGVSFVDGTMVRSG